MRSSSGKLGSLSAGAIAAIAALIAPPAPAWAAAQPQRVYACADRATGVLRLRAQAKPCRPNEDALQWIKELPEEAAEPDKATANEPTSPSRQQGGQTSKPQTADDDGGGTGPRRIQTFRAPFVVVNDAGRPIFSVNEVNGEPLVQVQRNGKPLTEFTVFNSENVVRLWAPTGERGAALSSGAGDRAALLGIYGKDGRRVSLSPNGVTVFGPGEKVMARLRTVSTGGKLDLADNNEIVKLEAGVTEGGRGYACAEPCKLIGALPWGLMGQ